MLYAKDLKSQSSSESDLGVIKKWYDESKHHYVKASSYDKRSKMYHIEAIMECLASNIGNILGVNIVDYWLDEIEEKNKRVTKVCVSEDYKYVLGASDFISAKAFLLSHGGDDIPRKDRYNLFLSVHPHLKDSLDKMIIFDYLIDNYDRHLRNFELYFLSDSDIAHLSPIFDNGSSLLTEYVDDEDLEDLANNVEDLFETEIVNAETQSKCFAQTHDVELRLVSKDSFKGLNLHLTKQDFEKEVFKFKGLITPLRLEMLVTLLDQRYNNLLKYYTHVAK